MIKNKIKFSVIIPVYNAEKFIGITLESVRGQSYSNYEVLVTNDGSMDNSEKVIQNYLKRYPEFPLQLNTQKNKGIGAARNNGLFRAKGDFLAFLDADDIWYKDKLFKVHHYLEMNPAVDIVYHNEIEIRGRDTKKVLYYKKVRRPEYKDLLFNGNKLSTSATVVRTELARRVNGFSERPDFNGVEDYDFWLKIAKAGGKFGKVNNVLGEYHRVENSITTKIEYHNQNGLNVFLWHLNSLRETERYSRAFLDNIERKFRGMNSYAAGMSFYFSNGFNKAGRYYWRAIKYYPLNWKPYVRIIQLLFKMVASIFLKYKQGTP